MDDDEDGMEFWATEPEKKKVMIIIAGIGIGLLIVAVMLTTYRMGYKTAFEEVEEHYEKKIKNSCFCTDQENLDSLNPSELTSAEYSYKT